MKSHHVSRVIDADPRAVYAFASDPDNLWKWAGGLAKSAVVRHGDVLLVDSPMGEVSVTIVGESAYGVIDHDVPLPSGTTVTNPVRVMNHPEGAEILFTIRQIELTDAEFDRDIAMVEVGPRHPQKPHGTRRLAPPTGFGQVAHGLSWVRGASCFTAKSRKLSRSASGHARPAVWRSEGSTSASER